MNNAEMAIEEGCKAIHAEFQRAVDKHGIIRTPLSYSLSDQDKLVILVEEVGEVARAITYDEGDKKQLINELVQVATMAISWAVCEMEYNDL